MAVTVTHSFQYILENYRKEHDLENDTLKMILMADGFTFDPETHATYADVSGDEIADGNGYTSGGETISNVAASINTTDSQVEVSADNVTYTASGGSIPAVNAAIVYNSSHADDTVVLCIEFDASYETPDGQLLQVNLTDGLTIGANA